MKKTAVYFLAFLILIGLNTRINAGNVAREFNIFAPPQTDYSEILQTVTLRPDGAGDKNTWDSGTYSDVNDQSDATYLESSLSELLPPWQEGLFSTENLSAGSGTINWVRVHIRYKDDATALIHAKVRTSMKTNGNEYDGAEVICSASWSETFTEYATNPSTGSDWTWNEIDNIQIGADGQGVGPLLLPVNAQIAEVWLEVGQTVILRPDGAGDKNTWDSGDYSDVNDQSDATYLKSFLSGLLPPWQEGLFSTENLSAGSGAINWVRVHIRYKDDATALIHAKVRTSMKTNGNEYDGAEVICSASWSETYTEYATNPSTGSDWTWNEIDNIQIGADGQGVGPMLLLVKAQIAEVWLEVGQKVTLRTSFVVVTAVIGNDYVTEVDIIDRDEDGDSDDTKEDLALLQGQSYIVYLKEGGVNDDYGGTATAMGDYFKIQANRRILTAIGTISDWEFDYVPPYFRSDGSVDFFVFVPYGSHADEWRLNVISYKDGTSVVVKDITNTPSTGSGYTSVKSTANGTEKWSGTLNKGEDILEVKGQNVLGSSPGGKTFYIHADDSVSVMVGSLKQAHSGRDGACYVKNGAGLNVGKEFYFYMPREVNTEKEIRINSYSETATINLWSWNGSSWDQRVTNQSMSAYAHYDYIGENVGYTQELFKLTSTGNVAIFTATWLETGASGTSDMATYISSEYGYGAGHNYIVYLAPPGYEINDERWSHAYITTIDSNATVTVKDMDFNGSIIDTSVVLNTNDFFDFKINPTTWNQLNAGDNRPYVKIYSEKEIRVFSSNWNDNWLAYAAGIVVPQYSELYYENFPYERWVFMAFPMNLTSNNPDNIFGPYFGGQESVPAEPDTNDHWRFSRWDIQYETYIRWGETDYDGGNHGDPPLPIPGRGYWMYQNYGSAIDLNVTGSTISSNDPYYISIDPPIGDHDGLSQVGNPFPFIIDWKNTEVRIDGNEVMSLQDANTAGLIDSWAYRWNGYEYIAYNSLNGGEFLMWDGFWVEQLDSSDQNKEFVIYKVEKLGSGSQLHTIKFHDARIDGDKDNLGENKVQETDRFNISVSGAGNIVGIITSAGGNEKYEFPLTKNATVLDDNGIRITLAGIDESVQYSTYRFEVSSESMTHGQGMNHIGFDFGDGQILAPQVPSQGNHTYTTTRTPMGTKSSKTEDLSLELKIPPTIAGKKGIGKVSDKYPYSSLSTSARDWFVPLEVSINDLIHDRYNGFGILTEASDGYDIYDARNFSPQLNKFVDIYFPHNDKNDIVNYWELRDAKLCYDMRSDSCSKNWKFNVSCWNVSTTDFTISWDASEINSDWDVYLINVSENDSVNMKAQNNYGVQTPSGSYNIMPFEIHADFTALLGISSPKVAEKFALLGNYPNPFNPTTTISYVINRENNVALSVYSIDGKLVKTLVNNRERAGEYHILWDGMDNMGRPVGSGVYFYRLITGSQTRTRKMLLLK